MLSYRHAYHAGNFADVMKHTVLVQLLQYLTRKTTPVCYIETHAGAGAYDLQSTFATKTGEYQEGIGLFWNDASLPGAMQTYLELVRAVNPNGKLRRYPGSPVIAQRLLRTYDRLELYELHTSDFPLLENEFRGARRVRCHKADGLRAAIAMVPPIEKRALVFIDPSYEVKDEYQRVFETLQAMHRRFATGIYALWYPVIDRRMVDSIRHSFEESGIRHVLNLELLIEPDDRGPGMRGCGVVIANPPWTMKAGAQPVLSRLAERLGRNGSGTYSIDQWVDE
jgi:23S rRNA (adenine2030-N6)-methyltransferase